MTLELHVFWPAFLFSKVFCQAYTTNTLCDRKFFKCLLAISTLKYFESGVSEMVACILYFIGAPPFSIVFKKLVVVTMYSPVSMRSVALDSNVSIIVFVDNGARYSYENQPSICGWNLSKLGEALAPLASRDRLVDELNRYRGLFQEAHHELMLKKVSFTISPFFWPRLVSVFLGAIFPQILHLFVRDSDSKGGGGKKGEK